MWGLGAHNPPNMVSACKLKASNAPPPRLRASLGQKGKTRMPYDKGMDR